jgi:hypothetical protein
MSAAYDSECSEAEARGWAVERADLGHLSMISRPRPLAEALVAIVGRLRRP